MARRGWATALVVSGIIGAGVLVAGVASAATPDSSKERTGPVGQISQEEWDQQFPSLICACTDAGVTGEGAIAACLARTYFKELDYTWPPTTSAHKEHRSAWALVLAYVSKHMAAAKAKGVSLCDHMRDVANEDKPAPSPPKTTTLPKWDPESVPGFVPGETYCGDDPDYPYNKAEWTDSGFEVYAALREFAPNVPPMRDDMSMKDQLVALAPQVMVLQSKLNSEGYGVAVNGKTLQVDGIIGACFLRALSYKKIRSAQADLTFGGV